MMNDQADQVSGTAARVLILDDEPCVADLLAEMLKLLGYRPTKCFSPVSALKLLEQEQFDVILSDYRMPQMNGDEFFNQAVSKSPALASRIVFLTGDAMNEEMQEFLARNGSRHLGKPFDLASVEKIICEIAGRAAEAAA